MRNLYARFVLWLIRPALKAHAGDRISVGILDKNLEHRVIDIIIKDVRKNGPIARAAGSL